MGNAFLQLKTLLIVHDASGLADPLSESLSDGTYDLLTCTASRDDIPRTVQSLKPQLLVMPFDQDVADRLATLREVVALRTTAVVVLFNDWDATLAKQVMDAGVSGYLIKPFDALQASAMLESSWDHFQKVVNLQENLGERTHREGKLDG